jgi:DNA-binding NarL/FixJ family response regulator
MTIEHARKLHDLNLLNLLSLDELRARIQKENEYYWTHIRRLMPKELMTNILQAKLCDREREIVEYVVHGFSNKEIAKRLSISERTVSTHLVNIYDKLGVHSRAALVTLVRAADRIIEASLRFPNKFEFGPFISGQES